MIRLMQLELKRISMKRYLTGTMIAFISIFLMMTSMIAIPDMEELPFKDVHEFLDSGALLLRVLFTILMGVMIANCIVKEYETGTILNLFLYPVAKKKIFISKLLVIIPIVFLLMLVAHLIMGAIGGVVNNVLHMLPGTVDTNTYLKYLSGSIPLMVATIATSMISLFVGMKMKSSIATIVSAVVIGLVVNAQFGSAYRLSSNILIMIVLSVIGVLIVFFSIMNVNKEDI